jgi:hypothetical protein
VNDSELWKDDGSEPSALERLVRSGPFDAAVELELPAHPTAPVLVRPLVAEPTAEWVAPLQGLVPPGAGQRVGVTASEPAVAARLAADAAVWFADRGRRSVVIDGCVVSPVLGKPLPEDGDEGLVDAALFGVSTSLAARRTLASGVSVMTAGSYPVSVEAVLGGEELERVLGSFASDVLVLIILPTEFVPLAAHALTGLIVAGETPEEVDATADRAGVPAVRTLMTIAVVTGASAGTARAPEEAGEAPQDEAVEEAAEDRPAPDGTTEGAVDGEAPPGEESSADRTAEDAAYGDEAYGEEPSPDRTAEDAAYGDEAYGEEPSPDRTARDAAAAEEEPDAWDRPEPKAVRPPSETGDAESVPGGEATPVVMTASRAEPEPKRRRSAVGIVLPLVVVAVAVGWWLFTNGPLATDRSERVPPRQGDVRSASEERPDGTQLEPAVSDTGRTDTVEEGGAAAGGDAAQDVRPTTPEAPAAAATAARMGGRGDGTGGTEPGGTTGERPWFEEDAATEDVTASSPSLVGPGGRYIVYVSSHRTASAAELEARRAARAGVPTQTVDADLGDRGLWHRLALPGGFPTLEAARLALDRLSELGYEGAWVEYHRADSQEG